MRSLRVIGRSLIDFFRDDGLMLAGSMSYFIMMALVPLCLFLVTLFGYFLGNYPEFNRFFLNRLANLFPSATKEITSEIMNLVSFKGLGTFSFVLYGFLSFQVFMSLENSMNVIFKVKKKRNLLWSVIISLTVVTLIIGLLMVSFAAASLTQLLTLLKPYLPFVKVGKVTKFIIRFVLPFILVLCSVTSVYFLIPKTPIRMAHAFQGAVFTTVFLELAKHIFTWYVATVVHFGRIYGPLTAFVVFLLWMFYSSSIFLVGAEVVHNLGREKKA